MSDELVDEFSWKPQKSMPKFHQGDAKSVEVEYSIDQICPDRYKTEWRTAPKLEQKEKLMKLIVNEYKNPETSDICIQIGEVKFDCHMLILQSFSNFFLRRLKKEKLIELKIENIQPDAFCSIYQWMISKSKKIERDGLIPLLLGAEYLEVDQLTLQCWNLIQNADWFKEDQAYLLYKEAVQWKFKKVQTLMMKQVKKIFLTIVASRDFVEMTKNEVMKWLELDNIGVNSEVDVFYAAVRWLLYDWQGREQYLIEIMKLIRFGLFPAWKIVILRKNENTGSMQQLLLNQQLQKYLEDSMSYSIYRNCFEVEDFDRFADFLKRFNFNKLFERNLMLDPYWQSTYKNSFYSYEDFQNYLNYIKSNALIHWTKIVSSLK